MRVRSDYTKLVDVVFWVVFLFFTNPGDIMMAMGEDRGDGGINVADLLFFVLMICYAFVIYKKDIGFNRTYVNIAISLIVFTIYHLLFYSFFVPEFKETANYTLKFILIKSRYDLYSILLFFMIYRFFIRSYKVFMHLFLYSSIIVGTLFLISFVTGVDILVIAKANRGFVNIDRIFLNTYGLMPFLIPMGVVIITNKFKISLKKIILIGFALMFLIWLLSLTRRHIFGTILLLIMGLMMHNYFAKKDLLPIGRIFSVFVYSSIVVFFIYLSFPKYVDAGVATFNETIYVMQHGETTTGRKDHRLGLGKEFMQNLIAQNFVWGTGFDNRWRTADGDKAGFETADYPFLSALAMKGVIGVLIFLPVYIFLIKAMRSDYKYLRHNGVDSNSLEFYLMVTFLLFFTFELIQYMNWFKPVSRMKDYEWYCYLAMYLGTRQIFYYKEYEKKMIKRKAEKKKDD